MLESIKTEYSVSAAIVKPACFHPVFNYFKKINYFLIGLMSLSVFGGSCLKGIIMLDSRFQRLIQAVILKTFRSWVQLGSAW